MSDILVRNVSPETLEGLKKRAERNRRSLQAEVSDVLYEVARRETRRHSYDEFLRIANEIAERAGPQTSRSEDLIREDRERDI